MADTTTANYGWTMPEVGASPATWGTKLNDFMGKTSGVLGVDAVLKAVSNVANAALPTAGGTVTGELIYSRLRSVPVTLTNGTSVTVDLSAGDIFTLDLDQTPGATIYFNLTNRPTTGICRKLIVVKSNNAATGVFQPSGGTGAVTMQYGDANLQIAEDTALPANVFELICLGAFSGSGGTGNVLVHALFTGQLWNGLP